jgi:hypothetical protein
MLRVASSSTTEMTLVVSPMVLDTGNRLPQWEQKLLPSGLG